MRRLKSVVRLDRGGGSLGGRGQAVGEVCDDKRASRCDRTLVNL